MSSLYCTDSTKISRLFQEIKDFDTCIEYRYEGTTYYSVKIGNQGGFENLRVLKEVDKCFNTATKQIESILIGKRVLKQEYHNTELIFYHKFRIQKVKN